METHILDQGDQKVEVVQRARGAPFVVAAADIQDETPIVFKNAQDLGCERNEPLNIVTFVGIPVLLLEMECVGW